MSLESASWVSQLSSSNPASSDPRSEGDDHLRLIKTALQNDLSATNREWVYTGQAISYAGASAFTSSDDQSGIWTAGRRVKVTGTGTGTVYGSVASSTYSSSTRVNLILDSGSLSNETLTPYVAGVTALTVPRGVNRYTQLRAKSATESVVNNTYQDDDDFSFTQLYKGQVYRFEAMFRVANASGVVTPDFKCKWVFSAAPVTSTIFTRTYNTYTSAFVESFGDMTTEQLHTIPYTGNGDLVIYQVGQFQVNASTNSTLVLQWAQQTTTGTNLSINAGGWAQYRMMS